MLITDNVNRTQYAVKIDGKVVYQNSLKSAAENYKECLSEEMKVRAKVVHITEDNREILFD